MHFDISNLLEQWSYEPGQVVVRKFMGKDGREKIQLRVDLGLLQMNAEGRPDGKRPLGHASLLEFHQHRLDQHLAEHNNDDAGFALSAEECAKLQLEALQYHHRYICLLQLEDFEGVVRDTARNLRVFDLVQEYAESDELAWSLQQFRPQLLMIHTRAKATIALQSGDYPNAIAYMESGIQSLKEFYKSHEREDLLEQSGEVSALENWLDEINNKRPLSQRERLQQALTEAVKREDYEKAAEVRDALRNLEAP